jgi:hypothetical protein
MFHCRGCLLQEFVLSYENQYITTEASDEKGNRSRTPPRRLSGRREGRPPPPAQAPPP